MSGEPAGQAADRRRAPGIPRPGPARQARAPDPDASIGFGPYSLYPGRRLLLRGTEPVRLGSRALDLLVLLAGRIGQTVGHAELAAAAWPGVTVEPNTLRVHVAALRRALAGPGGGHDYVATVTGRGYALVPPPPTGDPGPLIGAAGEPVPGLIGRGALVAEAGRRLEATPLLTLVGPGGVGKTAVARRVAALFAGAGREVAFVDLSPLQGGELVTTHVAAHLGLPASSADPTSTILRYLAGRRLLLVLDTCEHVVAEAARLAAGILAGAPDVRVLATSREALRVAGEHLLRVPGLALPAGDDPSPAEVLASPAARLFMERAAAAAADLCVGEGDAAAVAEVCRRLDGLPLAIELAAALAPRLGLRGLARGLADRFALLTDGYRTALPRHRTLWATVDWGYALLDGEERAAFRRLGVFRGTVAEEDAVAVLADGTAGRQAAAGAIRRLAAKSMVEMAPGPRGPLCRMLDTNRDFALAKLGAEGELEDVARRHAAYWAARLEAWLPDTLGDPERAGEAEALLANARAALRWCWQRESLRPLATRLALAAVPLWTNLSLIAETAENAGRALASADPADPGAARTRMRLHAALGGALMNMDGGGERVREAWTAVLRLADGLGDAEGRLQALWGLWIDRRNRGGAREALAIAEEFGRRLPGAADPLYAILGDRMLGVSLFFVGRVGEARRHIERMLRRSAPAGRRAQIAAFQFDQSIAARCFLGQALWLQGFPDQARDVTLRNVEDAIACDHAGSLSYALSEAACPVALRNGDLEGLARLVRLLLDRTKGPGLEVWHTLGRFFEGLLRVRLGEVEGGLRDLGAVVAELRTVRHGPLFTHFLGEYALALSDAGRPGEARPAIAEALRRMRANGDSWCLPELARVRAEVAARQGDVPAAERWLARSLAEGRRQGTLAWELRAATSLARLRAGHGGDAGEARRGLAAVLARYGEGWDTQDVRAARELLGGAG